MHPNITDQEFLRSLVALFDQIPTQLGEYFGWHFLIRIQLPMKVMEILANSVMRAPFCRLSFSHLGPTWSRVLNGIYFAFNSVQTVDHSEGIPFQNQCNAQTAAMRFCCRTACSHLPVVPPNPMACTAFLKCHSNAKRKAVTSSEVFLPSSFRKWNDLLGKPQLSDGPDVIEKV